MIARITLLYVLVFAGVLLALDAGAYAFMQREYVSFLGPALSTPEAAAGLSSAMRRVLETIALIDAPLLLLVAAASYLLARAAIAPLEAAGERERVFSADAAHELRSPLATIASVAQAARASGPPESREAFEEIARTALETSALVTDLLTLARNPRRKVLQCEPVDLAAIVSACCRDAQRQAQSLGVRLETIAAGAIVDGDERRLRELTRNVLENALRHARSLVRVTVQRNGRSCAIVVEDDGDGIAAEDCERVFERFYRRDHDGTGLGLAIVRWVARAHGGAVSAGVSELGGARVAAMLPAAKLHSPS